MSVTIMRRNNVIQARVKGHKSVACVYKMHIFDGLVSCLFDIYSFLIHAFSALDVTFEITRNILIYIFLKMYVWLLTLYVHTNLKIKTGS